MRSLLILFIYISLGSVLFGAAQSIIAEDSSDSRLSWIESLLDDEDKSFNSGNYLFYCSGHHGIIWSLIASDSSRIHLYNGTTRKHIEHANLYSFDTLSFINDNINTINWGIDSLDNAAQALTPLNDEAYNPIYNELYIIKENKIVFCSNNADYYSGPDSTIFNHHLSKLSYLMYWLAVPSCRPYLPVPCDTISLSEKNVLNESETSKKRRNTSSYLLVSAVILIFDRKSYIWGTT